jgi:arylsulfatase A-like enzyme
VSDVEVPKLPDVKVTLDAMFYLDKYKDELFFLAVGYRRPHTPLVCPKTYVDLYDPEQIPLPPHHALRPTAGPGVPRAAVRETHVDLFWTAEATPEKTREALAAYYGCVSFIDGEIGRLLAALDRLGLRDRTIVVLLSDHGYHLGDRGRWSKHNSLFEQAMRVPFIIDAPGTKGRGLASSRPVELVDLFPTLTALAGLATPEGVQGDSLVPLLENPEAAWDRPAYSETQIYNKARRLGRTIRTERWRYTEWDEGRAGVELYDHVNDPQEGRNLAGDSMTAVEHGAEIQALQTMLRAGVWMATVHSTPSNNQGAATQP